MRRVRQLKNVPKVSQLVNERKHFPSQDHLTRKAFALSDRDHAAQMFQQMWITEMLEIKLRLLKGGHLKSYGLWLSVVEIK